MNCCQPTGIKEDATINLLKLLKLIRLFTFILLGFSVFHLFISISSGIWMLFLCLFLYLIRYTKNFQISVLCSAVFSFQLIVNIAESGTILAQNGLKNNAEGFFMLIFMAKLPLYFLIIYYTYLTYKELKALHLEGNAGSSDYPMENLSQSSPNFVPFAGQGHSAG